MTRSSTIFRRLLLVAIACASTHCGDHDAPSGAGGGRNRASSGGILIYWNADLALVSQDQSEVRVAAAVIGFSTVELLALRGAEVEARALASPSAPDLESGPCTRTPIGVASAELDGVPAPDVLVVDTCGNYVVLNAGTPAERVAGWDGLLPPIPSYPYFELNTSPTQVSFVSGYSDHLEFWQKHAPDGSWQLSLELALAPWRAVTRIVVPRAPDAGWLAQSKEALMTISEENGALVSRTQMQSTIYPPNLVPYSGYDHLVSTPDPACALGIGMFERSGGDTPRFLQRLRWSTPSLDDVYDARDAIADINVTTFAVLPGKEKGTVLVGVVGKAGEQQQFALYELTQCEVVRKLAEIPIDFTIRTAPTPGFGADSHLRLSEGVMLVPYYDQDSPTFVHYDGYDVHEFRATATEGWSLSYTRVHVHDERQDLSVP